MDAFLSFYYLEKSAQLNFISKEGCQVLSFACNVSMCFVFIWRWPGIDPGVVDSKRATLINFIFLSKLFAPGPERAGPSADVFQIQHAFFLSNPNHAYTDSCVKTPSLIYGMAFAGYSCFRISALEKNWVTALANIIHSYTDTYTDPLFIAAGYKMYLLTVDRSIFKNLHFCRSITSSAASNTLFGEATRLERRKAVLLLLLLPHDWKMWLYLIKEVSIFCIGLGNLVTDSFID